MSSSCPLGRSTPERAGPDLGQPEVPDRQVDVHVRRHPGHHAGQLPHEDRHLDDGRDRLALGPAERVEQVREQDVAAIRGDLRLGKARQAQQVYDAHRPRRLGTDRRTADRCDDDGALERPAQAPKALRQASP